MEFVDYKCLENLLIEGTNLIATEQSTKLSTPGIIMDLDKKRDKINIRFFNKIWKVPVQYDTNDSANITDYTKLNKPLTNFAYYSKKHSTEIESRFVTFGLRRRLKCSTIINAMPTTISIIATVSGL